MQPNIAQEPIRQVRYCCTECRGTPYLFPDPEAAPSFFNWYAAIEGHLMNHHGLLNTAVIIANEKEEARISKSVSINDFLKAVYI